MSITRSVRVTVALVIGALLALGAVVPLAAAAPGTLRVLDQSSPSYGHAIAIAAPGGGTFTADPGRALVRLTPAAAAASQFTAWCVDRTRSLREGIDYRIDLQTPADTPELSGAGFSAAGWLIAGSDALIATAANRGREAAAIQLAVWRLTGQAADVTDVTPDAALNARAAALRDLAQGRTPVTALALSGPAGAAVVGAPATLTVTGTPGAVVDLSVASGSAALSVAQVTIGPSGTAQVTVTPAAAGEIVVGASAQGGALKRAAHLPGATAPQDLALIAPVSLTATTRLTVAVPTVTPFPAPAAAVPVTVAQVPAALRLVKSAPARIRRGRTIVYTLTVTNAGTVTARSVVVRDQLPAGTCLGRLPKAARLQSGAVVWRLGALAPGARVTVHLRLRTSTAPLGDVLNVAAASAANAATVRARATTRLIAPVRAAPAVVVPVTG